MIKFLFKSTPDNVDIAGVVFTRNLNNNGPYYYINYDTSGKTNFVTGGLYFEETKEPGCL